MFDGLLRELENSIGDRFITYADDLMINIEGNSRREIEAEGQLVIDHILEWSWLAKLQISDRKTEAILLRSKEIRRVPIGRRGGERADRKRRTRKQASTFDNRTLTIRLGDSKLGSNAQSGTLAYTLIDACWSNPIAAS
jgi:hypothetical protein